MKPKSPNLVSFLRQPLLWMTVCLLFIGCASDSEEKTRKAPDRVEEPLLLPAEDLTLRRDSLALALKTLEEDLLELKKPFSFIRNDFQGRSYYHKNWRRSEYNGQEDMLLAGVDSLGHFFLISNLRGGYPDEEAIHDRIRIEFDTSVVTLRADTLMGEFQSHQWLMCACRWEVNVYSREEAKELAGQVSQAFDRKHKVSFYVGDRFVTRASLSQKEKENIRDAFLLSTKISEKGLIETEIRQLQD